VLLFGKNRRYLVQKSISPRKKPPGFGRHLTALQEPACVNWSRTGCSPRWEQVLKTHIEHMFLRRVILNDISS
jgi:hypothetical protein